MLSVLDSIPFAAANALKDGRKIWAVKKFYVFSKHPYRNYKVDTTG